MELSLPFTLGSGLRLFRKHIAETTAQIQRVQWLLGEAVKPVVLDSGRSRERAPGTGADPRVSQGP